LTGVALYAAPAATAEPTSVVPEVPSGNLGVAFVDDPTIVDPHLMRIESWSRLGAGEALALNFTTGTPECYGVNATVHETAENVTVELRGGTRPEAVGRACIEIAVTGTLEVALQSPIGDRQVLSVN
ncbi:MAG TPA: hypothetical protein VJ777_04680, partial [Mycobacterium sp.]|nr:hypothetical protein [Mycobacterium sp.]